MIIQKWHIYKVILRGPFPKELELQNVGFEEMARTVYSEKSISEQEQKPTTNLCKVWRHFRDSNAGHICGRQVLSPLNP